MSRVIKCNRKGYEHVSVSLPDEWKGKHAVAKDNAIREGAKAHPDSPLFVNICVALTLAESIEGVPELEGSPDQWDIAEAPIAVITWLEETVNEDFLSTFKSERMSSPQSMKLLQELLLKDINQSTR